MQETPQQESPPLLGLSFGKANVMDFRAAGLDAVKTKKIPNGKPGRIADDDGNIWLTALKRVALSLIRRYAAITAGAREENVSRVTVKEAIRAFQSFPLADLTIQRRSELAISSPVGGNLYKVDFSSVEPYLNFVLSAVNGESSFLQVAKEDKEQTLQNLAKASLEALCKAEFPLWEYCLDGFCALSYTMDVADQIAPVYGRAPMKAKTELHIGQINMEIRLLRAVQSQYSAKISAPCQFV
ncbi:hypothetical protein MMC22_007723 [Lobaria immixta]|nr:hypothetical protein [Lobaria immixta]